MWFHCWFALRDMTEYEKKPKTYSFQQLSEWYSENVYLGRNDFGLTFKHDLLWLTTFLRHILFKWGEH